MADIAQLQAILNETLSPDSARRKKAEADLQQAQTSQPLHASNVLSLVQDKNTPQHIQQAAAIHFKNFVAKHWEDNSTIDKDVVRQQLVTVVLQSSNTTSATNSVLIEAVRLVGNIDYPHHWTNLLPQLMQTLQSGQGNTVAALLCVHAITKQFRYVERSDPLYVKLKYTLDLAQIPLANLYHSTGAQLRSNPTDPALLQALYLMTRVVYSLNYQDLPEYFEDTMENWMNEYAEHLARAPSNTDDDEDEESPLEKLQAAVVQVLDLYAQKDEESFMPFLGRMTEHVWQLLQRPRVHDNLATQALQFLHSLLDKAYHRDLFRGSLPTILQSIVLPNLRVAQTDQDRFDEDVREYMVIMTQGQGSESRRKVAGLLVRAMGRQFPDETVSLVGEHINQLLQQYASAPDAQWQQKDVAIHLMMGIAIVRENGFGVSEMRPTVNMLEFFQSHIIPELQEQQRRPMLQATALQFVCTFRCQFTREQLASLLPPLISKLSNTSEAVRSYACHTIERVLVTQTQIQSSEHPGRRVSKLQPADLTPVVENLLRGLFPLVEHESEYAMLCVTRTLAMAQNQEVVAWVLPQLTAVLSKITRNPQQPHFNHYLFEAIAAVVGLSNNKQSLDTVLFPPMTQILQQQVVELQPYVLQILAQLLEKSDGVADSYSQLFVPLLTPDLWEDPGSVPALARLLQAYVAKAGSGELILAQLQGVLGIFQRLLAFRNSEEFGFQVIRSILVYVPMEALEPHVPTILSILLTLLQQKETHRRLRGFTNVLSLWTARHGVQSVWSGLNRVQPGLAGPILQNVWAKRWQDVPPKTMAEAKEHVIAATRLLCETPTPPLVTPEIWQSLVRGLATWLTSPLVKQVRAETTNENGTPEALPDLAYDAAYSKLSFATQVASDYFAHYPQPTADLCRGLAPDGLRSLEPDTLKVLHQVFGQVQVAWPI